MRTKLLASLTVLSAIFLFLSLHNSCYFEGPEPISDLSTLQLNLSSTRSCVRSKAALDIQKLGSAAEAVTGRLVELLSDPDPAVRWRSVGALGYIGHFPESVRNELYKMIYDEHETTRANTIFAVAQMQFNADKPFTSEDYIKSDEEFEVFLLGLKDPSSTVRYKTLLHLSATQIKNNGQKYGTEFQNELLNLTHDSDPRVEGMALAQLSGLLGIEAVQKEIPEYKSRISRFLSSDNIMIKRAAAITLAELDAKEYPHLLVGPDGHAEKAKAECDSGTRVYGACYHYAKLLQYNDNIEESTRYYEKDCGLAGQFPGYGCTDLGDQAFAAGDIEKAKDFYKRTASIKGTNNSAIVKLGDIYTQENNQEEACHWYLLGCANGIEAGCSKGQDCNTHQSVVRATGITSNYNLKKAEQAYQDAVESEKKGDRAAALKYYLEAHNNGYAIATIRAATLYRETGRIEEAVKVLSESCESLQPVTCIELGLLHQNTGNIKDAEESLKKACQNDRTACSEHLAQFYLLKGNRSEALSYLEFLCKNLNDQRACDNVKMIEDKIVLPENLVASCNNGKDADCRSLATLHIKNHDYDKALSTYKTICDREKTLAQCQDLIMALWNQKRWDEYRLLNEDICRNDKEACYNTAILEEHLVNLDKAIVTLEKLCLNDKMSKACTRLHKIAVRKYSSTELKDYLGLLCDTHKETRSCALSAALYAGEGDEDNKSKYFDSAISLADAGCETGDLEHCASKALFLCASGKFEDGKEEMEKACNKSTRYCRFVDLCPNALEEISNNLKAN